VCSRLAGLFIDTHWLRQPTIDAATPEGFLVRSTWADMMDIYEINRKESARVLLDSARWFKPGTFRPKPGTVPPPQPDDPPPMGYQLELSVMEVSGPLCSYNLFMGFAVYHHQHARPTDLAT